MWSLPVEQTSQAGAKLSSLRLGVRAPDSPDDPRLVPKLWKSKKGVEVIVSWRFLPAGGGMTV